MVSAFIVVCVFVCIYTLITFTVCMLLHKMKLKGYIRTKLKLLRRYRVYDNTLQRAQKCIDVKGDNFQHLL